MMALAERGRQDRQRGRCGERRAGTLHEPGEDEQRPVARDRAEHRGGDQRDEAPHEHSLTTEHISTAASEQEKTAIAKDEGGDDPLQLRLMQVQIATDRGQRDLDQGQVESVEKDGSHQNREQQLLRACPERMTRRVVLGLQSIRPGLGAVGLNGGGRVLDAGRRRDGGAGARHAGFGVVVPGTQANASASEPTRPLSRLPSASIAVISSGVIGH